MNQPSGESIWGNINTAIEIALNIYLIIAKDKDGIEHEGVMIPKSKASEVLSKEAVTKAEQDGDWLCYGEDTKSIPMYEMLQRRIADCRRMEKKAIELIQNIKKDSNLRLKDYFGECAPPFETDENSSEQFKQIRNGIYFIQLEGEDNFAVHDTVADKFMSDMAKSYGKRQGEYLLHDLTTAAIPLFELRKIYDEVDELILSEDSLLATLSNNLPAYMDFYNDFASEETKILPTDAPVSLFLQKQLDRNAQDLDWSVVTDKDNDLMTLTFGEEAEDFGFEP